MDFRNGDEPEVSGLEASALETTEAAAAQVKAKEAGSGPAVAMAEKTDAGSEALVAQMRIDESRARNFL